MIDCLCVLFIWAQSVWGNRIRRFPWNSLDSMRCDTTTAVVRANPTAQQQQQQERGKPNGAQRMCAAPVYTHIASDIGPTNTGNTWRSRIASSAYIVHTS